MRKIWFRMQKPCFDNNFPEYHKLFAKHPVTLILWYKFAAELVLIIHDQNKGSVSAFVG